MDHKSETYTTPSGVSTRFYFKTFYVSVNNIMIVINSNKRIFEWLWRKTIYIILTHGITKQKYFWKLIN